MWAVHVTNTPQQKGKDTELTLAQIAFIFVSISFKTDDASISVFGKVLCWSNTNSWMARYLSPSDNDGAFYMPADNWGSQQHREMLYRVLWQSMWQGCLGPGAVTLSVPCLMSATTCYNSTLMSNRIQPAHWGRERVKKVEIFLDLRTLKENSKESFVPASVQGKNFQLNGTTKTAQNILSISKPLYEPFFHTNILGIGSQPWIFYISPVPMSV